MENKEETFEELIYKFHFTTDNIDRATIGNYMDAFKRWLKKNNYKILKK